MPIMRNHLSHENRLWLVWLWSSLFPVVLPQFIKKRIHRLEGGHILKSFGIWTHELCDAGVVLYQLTYWANWELVILWVRNVSVEEEKMNMNIWNTLWTAGGKLNRRKTVALFTQLKQLRNESLKNKIRLEQNSKPFVHPDHQYPWLDPSSRKWHAISNGLIIDCVPTRLDISINILLLELIHFFLFLKKWHFLS